MGDLIGPSAAEVRGLLEHYKLTGHQGSELFEREQEKREVRNAKKARGETVLGFGAWK